MIPIPPLDGSRVLDRLMPDRLRPAWESFSRMAPLFLFAAILYGGAVAEGPSRPHTGRWGRCCAPS
jgi:Zn-dependent protease